MDFIRTPISYNSLIIEYVISILLIVLFLIAPGWLILNILYKNKDHKDQHNLTQYFSLSIIISFTIFAVISFLGYLISPPLYYLLVIELIMILILLFYNFKLKCWRVVRICSVDWLVIILSMVVFVLTLFPYTPLHGDAAYHFGYYRRIAESGILSPAYSIYKIQDYLDPVYSYNIWYAFCALICRFGNIDAQHFWFILLSIVPALTVFSFGYLAKALLPKNKFVVIAIIVYVLEEIITRKMLAYRLSGAPGEFARVILIPIFLGLVVEWWRSRDRWKLIIICLMVPALIYIHGFDLLYAFIGLVTLLPLFFINPLNQVGNAESYKKMWKNIGIGSLITAIICAPLLWLKLNIAKIVTSSFVTESPKKSDVGVIGNLYYVKLDNWTTPYYICGLIAFILLTVLAIVYRKKIIDRKNIPYWILSIGLFVIPVIIMHFPPVASLASKYISYTYTHRLMGVLPFALLISGLIYFLSQLYKKYSRIIILTGLLAVLFLDVIVALQRIPFGKRSFEFRSPKTRALESLGRPSYLDALNNIASIDSVVLSDNTTSHYLRGVTRYYVVMVTTPHIPQINDRRDRSRFSATIFDPSSNYAKTLKYLRMYQVDYVLIKKNINGTPNVGFDKFEIFVKKYPNNFEKVFSDDEYSIYMVN